MLQKFTKLHNASSNFYYGGEGGGVEGEGPCFRIETIWIYSNLSVFVDFRPNDPHPSPKKRMVFA